MSLPDPSKKISEVKQILKLAIDHRDYIDLFSVRKYERMAKEMHVISERFEFLGFVYGAAGRSEDAIDSFKKGAAFRNASIARNYLAYLSRARHYELYRLEAIRIAREISDYRLFIRARNAAYASGDIDLSSFFAKKAIAMVREDSERKALLEEFEMHKERLEKFQKISGLLQSEIEKFTLLVVNVTNKFNVTAVAHDFYSSVDSTDAAVICDVMCDDPDTLAEMDIEIATVIAMSDMFSLKNVTAWYRVADGHTSEALQ